MKSVTAQMTAIMKEFCEQETETVTKISEEVADDVKKDLKRTSPKTKGGRKHYANGWTVNVQKLPKGVSCIVHNKTKYRLTHLLERGHVAKNQYGEYGRVAAKPHIAPAEERGIEEFMRKLEREL